MKLIGKNEKIQESLKELERGLETFQSSNIWKDYLDTVAQFHNYSPCNCILIKLQKPQSTYVAGYHTWKKLGRYVKKGEQGIAILAPVYKKIVKEVEIVSGEVEEVEETILIGFKTVYVWDISQTEGEELTLNIYNPLKGEAPEDLITAVEKYISSLGYLVVYGDCGKAEGYVQNSKKVVYINLNREPITRLATLVHELAHIILEPATKDEEEFEAESVSYVILKTFGIDTGQAAFPYITIWHPTLKDFLERAEKVRRASNIILENLEKYFLKTVDNV